MNIVSTCLKKSYNEFYLFEGYFFNKEKLCMSQRSIKKFLVKESHNGGFMGHFG